MMMAKTRAAYGHVTMVVRHLAMEEQCCRNTEGWARIASCGKLDTECLGLAAHEVGVTGGELAGWCSRLLLAFLG